MDSLLFLCTRRVVAQRPLPALPAGLYPVLFQVAFLDGRPWVLRDLVAAWPFSVLNFERLLGHRKLLRAHNCRLCLEAIIQGLVAQLWWKLEDSSSDCSLRMLDLTGLSDYVSGGSPDGLTVWFSTEALAKACVKVSKHQQVLRRRRSKRHKGRSGAATAAPQPLGVDVHTDLFVNRSSYEILCEALQTGAASPLRLKCREFQAEDISASEIVILLESLDPSCLRRVDLRHNDLGLTGLSVILPHLSRFPELRSLKVLHNNLNLQHLTPELANGMRCVARHLGMLPSLRELNLQGSRLSGNLQQILGDLQAPLESLELVCCPLLPADLTFLSQSFHSLALKKLDLSGHEISQGLLEPLRLLLEKTSASLLCLNLMDCCMADFHLDALLPSLLRCSRLRFLGLYGNFLSMSALKYLLQNILELPDLHRVVYSYPMNCYMLPGVDKEAEFSRILANSRRTNFDWTCTPVDCRVLDYFSL